MIRLRKTDHLIQCALGVIMFLAVPVFFYYDSLAGLFLLACWQLVSAFFNTTSFYNNGMGYQICSYWKFTGLIFALLFVMVPLSGLMDPNEVKLLVFIAVTAALPVAIYYLKIYKKLIGHLVLRDELGGLIRSKH